jgi:hypothetical protein
MILPSHLDWLRQATLHLFGHQEALLVVWLSKADVAGIVLTTRERWTSGARVQLAVKKVLLARLKCLKHGLDSFSVQEIRQDPDSSVLGQEDWVIIFGGALGTGLGGNGRGVFVQVATTLLTRLLRTLAAFLLRDHGVEMLARCVVTLASFFRRGFPEKAGSRATRSREGFKGIESAIAGTATIICRGFGEDSDKTQQEKGRDDGELHHSVV